MKKIIISVFVLFSFIATGIAPAQAIILPEYLPSPVITGVSGPQTLKVGQTGTWQIKAYSQSGSNLSYSVDWGERGMITRDIGATMVMPLPQQTSSFNHVYNDAGNYTVTFTVTNDYGQSVTTSISVNVKGYKIRPSTPVITGISGPQSVRVNQTGTWEVKTSGDEKGNLSYSVDWGDNLIYVNELKSSSITSTSIQTATFSHSYQRAGNYTARFTVTDSNGQSVTKSLKIKVKGISRYDYFIQGGTTNNNIK